GNGNNSNDNSSMDECGDCEINGYEICDGDDLDGATCLVGTTGTPTCSATCDLIDRSSCAPIVPCDGACTGGTVCIADVCQCASPFEELCDDTCTPILEDDQNCGGCGIACDVSAPFCAGGVCVASCPTDFTARDGRCVDPETDSRSCGDPAVDCEALGQVCVDGTCGTGKATLTPPAACGGGVGVPIEVVDTINDSIETCAAELASVTFRRAVCSCDSISLSQSLSVDGFSSADGPYNPATPGLGAGVGLNAELNVSQDVIVYGTLTASGDGTCAGDYSVCAEQLLVRQNVAVQNGIRTNNEVVLTCDEITLPPVQPAAVCQFPPNLLTGGDIQAQGGNIPPSSFSGIDGDLTRETGASLPTNLPVGGTSTEITGVVVEDPCDCSEPLRIPVADIVDSRACPAPEMGETLLEACARADNDNFEAGLTPDLFDVNNPVDGDTNGTTGRIDLPCGNYYFTNILANAGTSDSAVTIAINGNTAIYVGGDIDTQRRLRFVVGPNGQLDIFVKGSVRTILPLTAGSKLFPSRTRAYVANDDDDARAVDLNQGGEVAGNFYAPEGEFFASADVELFGSLFAGSVGITQDLMVHYDTDIVDLAPTCAACGNGVVDTMEQCDGDAVSGQSCSSLGFDAGMIGCTEECLFDISDCRVCGDGTVDAPEECDGSVPGGADCEDLGFDGGDTTCGADCRIDTSACTTSAVCGDGVVEDGEECEPTVTITSETCEGLGFDGGTLGCTDECRFDTEMCRLCGNGVAEPGEVCDGSDGLMSVECPDGRPGEVVCNATCDAVDETQCVESCDDCRDCANQACVDPDGDGIRTCGECETNADCCSPLFCFDGVCILF
ncbi:MAG: hypothetical protein AAF658_03820, partial [Myxococcota bacterium]